MTSRVKFIFRSGQLAKRAALHVMQVLWAATVYLGRTALDLINAIRRALLLRNRRKFPERAAAIDSTVAILRTRKTRRWSSWAAVPTGRRIEIRAAAAVIVIAVWFVTRAYLNRGASPPSTAADSERARQFLEMCTEATPGQWVVFGAESARIAQANLARAQAEFESARANARAAGDKWARSTGRVDQATGAANRLARDSAEKNEEAKGAAVSVASMALSQAQRPHFEPVLNRGDLNQWDDFKVMSPVVIKDGSRYRMWYVGCHFIGDEYTCGVGHAQSRDGVGWEKSPGPVLSIADPAASQYLHSIAVAHVGREYMMWYAIDANPLQGNECATLNLAISKDGIAWKPQGQTLTSNCKNTAHLWQSVFYDGKTIHLWYSDYDSSANGLLMHLTSSDGKNWQKAGSTDIGTLGIDPRRIWVLPEHASGYRALFAQRPKGHSDRQFGILRSSDLSTWRVSNEMPGLSEVWSGYQGQPQSPAASVEPSGLWLWFALHPDDGADAIALAFQKEAKP